MDSFESQFAKSSYCEDDSGLCVEVAKSADSGEIGVRHSSFPGEVVPFSSNAWGCFIRQFVRMHRA
ncbi:DUF397 domain-containing protein [Streptomyces sp. NPDC002962]|uniref:DUF397 domain-containing protein n=1 Tax=Streptomyces sp. NPDC002962 TaxID=3364674 RepID=UPI0036BDE2E0